RLETNLDQPYSQTLAKWVRYRHAIDADDPSTAEDVRKQLQKIVEDKKAPWAQRDLAMDSLVAGGPWQGRDDWYLSLFEDESLLAIQENGYTGMTTLLRASEPMAWQERMIKLLKSGNATVRSVAARNLMSDYDGEKEILVALTPWLRDAKWARESNQNE